MKKYRSFLMALSMTVSLVASVLVFSPPASAYEPPEGGVFNVPRPWGTKAQKYRIVSTVEKAIRKTPGPTKAEPNPRIVISTYLLDRKPSVDALVAACRRGVSVRVIMDEDIENKNSRRIIRTLNGDNVPDRNGDGIGDRKPRAGACNRPLKNRVAAKMTGEDLARSMRVPTEDSVTWGKDKSYAKKCDGSCRGRGGNMHSKFFLFSKTGTARNVVIVSSSNLNRGGAELGWNDGFVINNRATLYNGFNTVHREMTEDSRAGDRKVEVRDGRYTARFFPMRNAGKRKDPTLKDLNQIGCRSALGRTQIHVSMFYWKGSRGQYLATKLLNLARQGCSVNIIYGAPSLEIAERLRNAAKSRLINLYDSRWDMNNDGYNEVRTHAKYVLVKGRYGGKAKSWQVLTGSQNWVAGSLSRGDEVTLNVASRSAYNDYRKNWQAIRKHSRRMPLNR